MAQFEEKPARDLVNRLIESFGGQDTQGVVPFVRLWHTIVGPDAAAHSRVIDIRNGAVVVGVDHPAWIQRMHLQRDKTVKVINRQFPDLRVRYIHFVVVDDLDRDRPPAGRDLEQPPPIEPVPRQPERTKPDKSTGEAAADDELQRDLDSLRRAIERRRSD